MSTSVDTMKNFFNILKLYSYDTTTPGITILDQAVRTVSHFASLQDAVNHFIYDVSTTTATTGNPLQSLLQNCGIVIGADYDFTVDTGAVSGYNAGMGVVKNAQDIVPESGTLDNVPLPAVNGFTSTHSYTGADGKTFTYTVTYPDDYFKVLDFATAQTDADGKIIETTAQKVYLQAGQTYGEPVSDDSIEYSGEEVASSILTMLKGIENYWMDEAVKLAYDSFGLDFNNKNINVQFCINSPGFVMATGPVNEALYGGETLPVDDISMIINSIQYTNIDASDPNGNTYKENADSTRYLDRTLAHEMIHGVMHASGTVKENMPEFFTEGVAELVQGLDDYDGTSSYQLVIFAIDPSQLADALEFKEGTGTPLAYPAGYMFLRYLCHQALPTNVVIGNGTTPDLFSYTGNEEIISGAASGSQINFGAGIFGTAASAGGDDLFVNTTVGNLIIRDARGKLVNFANENGTVTARSYVADAAGTIDGRAFGEYEILFGADNVNNEIRAGDGGSQLWGGAYGSDDLNGGNGVDEFIAGVGCGSDNIFGADSNDVINLAATTLDQITGSTVNANGVALSFSDGSSLTVAGEVNATFKLSDGSTYLANQATGQWAQTN